MHWCVKSSERWCQIMTQVCCCSFLVCLEKMLLSKQGDILVSGVLKYTELIFHGRKYWSSTCLKSSLLSSSYVLAAEGWMPVILRWPLIRLTVGFPLFPGAYFHGTWESLMTDFCPSAQWSELAKAELLDVMREYEKLQICTQSAHVSFDSWGNQFETMLKITPFITGGEYNISKAPFPVRDIAQRIY